MKKFFKPRMKSKRLLVKTRRIYEASRNWTLKFFNWDKVHSSYKSLSPIDSADKEGQYYHALKWALKNREKEGIRNIALTGGYGSGKSSILKTFQSKYRPRRIKYIRRGIKYLNISLATFKEEKIPTDPERQKKILQLIEESILQQIFYHEKDSTIPDSRFKKIKRIGLVRLIITAVCAFAFLAAIVNYFYPCFLLEGFRDLRFGWITWMIIHYGTYAILAAGSFWIILKSIRAISVLTISKLKLSDAEIGFGDKTNKSTLNHHLDEIIYFFEATGYNVVCIEDLDRFQETEIFTKLREINLLLNNSRKTKHLHIVFIYAVRDEMFKDKDRTKFFDFIVPVIPVINSNNSTEKLIIKRDENRYKISNNFLESISLYIDDMRLLHNVMNEFKLYASLLDKTLKPDNLLAMMLYKNLMPYDFAALAKGEGILFKCLTSKNKHIESELEVIENRIKSIGKDIERLSNLRITDVAELRKLYLIHYLEGLTYFHAFFINGANVTVTDATSDVNFEYFIKDQATYYSNQYGNNRNLGKTFDQVEKLVGPVPYAQRLQDTRDWHAGKLDLLRNEVKTLEEQKVVVRNFKLQDILKSKDSVALLEAAFKEVESSIEEDQKISIKPTDKDLIKFLLRNGHINEEYLDYISIFYEGVITRSDKQFLIQLTNNQSLEFDYRLNKIDSIIKKINSVEFERTHVLNYDLLNFMLDKPEYGHLVERVFKRLKDQSPRSLEFIDKFSELTPHQNLFYQGLVGAWREMWKYMKATSAISERKKLLHLTNIIAYVHVDVLREMAKDSSLKEDVQNDPQFLSRIADEHRLITVIADLELKFRAVDFESSPRELLTFLFNQNAYEINPHMVSSLLKLENAFDQVGFDTRNYDTIRKSGLEVIIKYIEANINQYISRLYLRIESNKADPEERLIELLNNDQITPENKGALIANTGIKVIDLNKVKTEMWSSLLTLNKVEPNWQNVHAYYSNKENVIDDSLLRFLNDVSNAEAVSVVKMPKEGDSTIDCYELAKSLALEHRLNNESFKRLASANSWWFSSLDLSAHGSEKIKILIDNRCIKPVKATYDYLKNTFKENVFHIQMLESSKNKFFENPQEFVVDGNDLNAMLKSGKFTTAEKINIIEIVGDAVLLTNLQNLSALNTLMKADPAFKVNDGLFGRVITHADIDLTERLRLFIARHSQVHDASDTTNFLNSLATPYSELTIEHEEIEIPYSELNENLLKVLKNRQYILNYKRKKEKLIATKTSSQ